MKSGLTAFELEIQEIEQTLEMSLKERQKLESLIKSTKPNRKNKNQKESEEAMSARKNLETLNRYVSQLSQQRRQIIQDMHTYEFLLWASDEKPGYWG